MTRLTRIGMHGRTRPVTNLLRGGARRHGVSGLLLLPCLALWLWLAACEADPQANRYAPPPPVRVATARDGTPPIDSSRAAASSVYSDTQDIGVSVPTPFRGSAESPSGTGRATVQRSRAEKAAGGDGTPPKAIDDAGITAEAEARLRATPGLDADGIRVETRQGAVLLSGEVATPQLSNRASMVTRRVVGVRHVDNRLTVTP